MNNSCYPGISIYVFLTKKADMARCELPKAKFTCPICIVTGVAQEDAERSITEGFVPLARTKIDGFIDFLKKNNFTASRKAPVRALVCPHCHASGF